MIFMTICLWRTEPFQISGKKWKNLKIARSGWGHLLQPYIEGATTLSDIIGRAKRAPHWGVQSRFRMIY